MTDAAPRRRGRPPRPAEGEPATRDRILHTARAVFAEQGYDRTSVRGIAKAANVDPALVHHYFGTKEGVFAAAVQVALAPALSAAAEVDVGARPEEAGERLTGFFFGVWESPETRGPLLAIMRSALNNDTAAAVFRELVANQLLRRIADQLAPADAELRAELAASQLVGAAFLRYVIGVQPLASAPVETVVGRLAPVVQWHLTGA
ncbi:TetR family transcriptional regulator [Streptomyces sp. NPDC050560]|uniref:TetR/AcrR family transcriptional regulator n=1 Tax=Streptomyces sp. NPDC050560 TaxID=3365630 RepID=UPI003794DD99